MIRKELSIGEVAERAGLSVSQIRFYEARSLIAPPRNAGGQRRSPRAEPRRLSFIRIAQRLGLSLRRIRAALRDVPAERAPTPGEWERVAADLHGELTDRIETMTRLRDRLSGCIDYGCLGMTVCPLYNPDDVMAARQPGAGRIDGS